MSLNRREFLVVAAGGAGWMALNHDGGDDGDLVGGGGTVDDWLTVATATTETLVSGETNDFEGIDWEGDGAISWEDGAALTLRDYQ